MPSAINSRIITRPFASMILVLVGSPGVMSGQTYGKRFKPKTDSSEAQQRNFFKSVQGSPTASDNQVRPELERVTLVSPRTLKLLGGG